MANSEAIVKLVELVTGFMSVCVLALFLWDVVASRRGWSRAGWGWIGFFFLLNATGVVCLSALAKQALPDHPDPVVAASLDALRDISTFLFGGFGVGLLIVWLTEKKSPPPPRPNPMGKL